MGGLGDWIFPSTRVGEVVRMRPLALEVLYRARVQPWDCPELTLQEVCRRCGISLPELLRTLTELPRVRPDAHWERRPLCHLVDHLVAEHRDLAEEDLPAIREALDRPPEGAARDEELFSLVTRAFHSFSDKLRAHLREEEDTLFPALLRNEYLHRNTGDYDEPARVSGKIAAAAILLQGEEDFAIALRYLLEQARTGVAAGAGDPVMERAVRLIAGLGARLEAHARLEREVLLPRAEELEHNLGEPASA